MALCQDKGNHLPGYPSTGLSHLTRKHKKDKGGRESAAGSAQELAKRKDRTKEFKSRPTGERSAATGVKLATYRDSDYRRAQRTKLPDCHTEQHWSKVPAQTSHATALPNLTFTGEFLILSKYQCSTVAITLVHL